MTENEVSYKQLRGSSNNTLLGFNTSGEPSLIGPFLGATNSIDGEWGYVPKPIAGDENKFLKGDGTWAIGGGGGGLTSIGLVVNSSGSDVGVAGSPLISNGNITLSIPDASPSSRGVVTSGAQSFGGAKYFQGSLFIASSGNTITASTAFEVRSSVSLSTNVAKFADSANQAILIIKPDGKVHLGTQTNLYFTPVNGGGIPGITTNGLGIFTGTSGIKFRSESGTYVTGFSLFEYHTNITALVSSSSQEGYFSRLRGRIDSNPTPATGGIINWLAVTPELNNTTGTLTSRGIYYNPQLTATAGVTHQGIVIAPTTALNSFGNSNPLATMHVTGTLKFDLGSDATGDIFFRGSDGFIKRRALGSNTQVLISGGGEPIWADSSILFANTAEVNEVPKTLTDKILGPSGVFVTTNGNVNLGNNTLAGNGRTIEAFGSSSNIHLYLKSKVGNVLIDHAGVTSGFTGNGLYIGLSDIRIGDSITSGTDRNLRAQGSDTNINLHLYPKGATGYVNIATTNIRVNNLAATSPTTQFLRGDGVWEVPAGGGGGGSLTDGDKGDITVANSGVTWTIDPNAVTTTKIADANITTIKILDANITEAKLATNSVTTIKIADLNVTTAKIANDAVTFTKLANITSGSFIGRITTGTGDPELLTPTQATSLLNVFNTTTKGLVPPGTTDTSLFLRGDGVWVAPPTGGGGGGLTSVGITLGTSGTAPNVSGSPLIANGSIIINLPDAATNARGLVSTGAQSIAGVKTFTSAPIFSSTTAGSVYFAGTGGALTQDNSTFFWDNTNKKLIIGANSAGASQLALIRNANTNISTILVNNTNTGTTATSKITLQSGSVVGELISSSTSGLVTLQSSGETLLLNSGRTLFGISGSSNHFSIERQTNFTTLKHVNDTGAISIVSGKVDLTIPTSYLNLNGNLLSLTTNSSIGIAMTSLDVNSEAFLQLGDISNPGGFTGQISLKNNGISLYGSNTLDIPIKMKAGGTNQVLILTKVPTANPPANSGYIYMEAGALKYRGPSGTITTIAAA